MPLWEAEECLEQSLRAFGLHPSASEQALQFAGEQQGPCRSISSFIDFAISMALKALEAALKILAAGCGNEAELVVSGLEKSCGKRQGWLAIRTQKRDITVRVRNGLENDLISEVTREETQPNL